MRKITIVAAVLALGIGSLLAARAFLDYVTWEMRGNRMRPDMVAIAAAVERFYGEQGRLPTQEEYLELQPNPDFSSEVETDDPDTWTSFRKPDQRVRDIHDPLGDPYILEKQPPYFVIISFGLDGVPSKDDWIYDPYGLSFSEK